MLTYIYRRRYSENYLNHSLYICNVVLDIDLYWKKKYLLHVLRILAENRISEDFNLFHVFRILAEKGLLKVGDLFHRLRILAEKKYIRRFWFISYFKDLAENTIFFWRFIYISYCEEFSRKISFLWIYSCDSEISNLFPERGKYSAYFCFSICHW